MCIFHIFMAKIDTKLEFLDIVATDKETDESWDVFIIQKINSGLV